jgi:hypothetical protein
MARGKMVKVGDDWVDGFQVGRQAAMADWEFRRGKEARDFQRLVWRLQAKKYWANKNPESKARIQEYRREWARKHRERMNEYSRKAKKKLRANSKYRAKELAKKRAKHAEKSAAMRADRVYTCVVCGAQWCQLGRIPSRPPKYCTQSCRGRANYQRGKAAGKAWAARGKAYVAAQARPGGDS